jgi:hypothetical protein
VRWVGIRHGDDHVHLVATLVRQDGRTVWAWNDYAARRPRRGVWSTGPGCTGPDRTGRRREPGVDQTVRVAAGHRRAGIEECSA